MNSLAFKLTEESHKEAQIVMLVPDEKHPGALKVKFLSGAGYLRQSEEKAAAQKEAREKRKEWLARNEQVKNDLGIEFEYRYVGLFEQKQDIDWMRYSYWCGDEWEITGKGDFKIKCRRGFGHRVCFWINDMRSGVAAFVTPPSAMNILSSVRVSDPRNETFETWCRGYDYDPDSRTAENRYRACLDQTMMFKRNYDVNLDEYEPLDKY